MVTKEPPQWLFFDLDGTITDSLPGIEFSIRESFSSIGFPLLEKDIRRYIGPGIRTILRNIEPGLSNQDMERMVLAYRNSYDTTGCLRSALYTGVSETLRRLLMEGMQLFIVTNKPSLATRNLLNHFGLAALFREIASPDSRSPSYPSKSEMLIDLITRYRVDVERACMIGDTAEDMAAARDANIAFVHSAYGYGTLTTSEVDSIQEFPSLLKTLGF